MGIHSNHGRARLNMCKFADREYANTPCIPTFGWGIGSLREPDRFPGIETPYSGTVEDGAVFASLSSVIAANAYTGPFLGGGCVERSKNIGELGVEDFLETEERGRDVARVDFERGDNQRQPNGPCFFTTERTGGGISDIVGEKANRNGWRV